MKTNHSYIIHVIYMHTYATVSLSFCKYTNDNQREFKMPAL